MFNRFEKIKFQTRKTKRRTQKIKILKRLFFAQNIIT